MIKRKTNLLTRVLSATIAAAMVVFGLASTAMASQITGRQVVIGSPVASASTTYAFTFTVPSATAIKSASFTACTTASGTCTMPTGFANASSTLTSQPTNLGAASGWTVNTATSGSLRLLDASNSTAPSGSQTVSFSSVTNPSAVNSTFFLRIVTYSDSAWTTPIDTGTVATSTGGQVTVDASVDEALTFTIAAQAVHLGTITTSTTGTGTSSMSASSNASHGYNITYSGTSLTDGSHPFGAMAGVTPTQGVNQFGLNLALNNSPAVAGSAAPSGGSGVAGTGYGTANSYKFNTSGDTIATAPGASNTTTFTTSYLANVDAATPAGSYSTVLSYVATPNF